MTLDYSYSTLTPEERLEECARIIEMFGIGALDIDQLEEREKSFVESMTNAKFCSPKQLQWLRKIKDKYL